MLFDVGHDEISSGEMIDAGRSFGIVHRVGHIPQQGDVLAQFHQLANAEGTTQNTHVQVDATKDDIVNSSFCQKVEGFLAVVSDGISGMDFQEFDLLAPGVADLAFVRSATAAHVRVVDGEYVLEFRIGPAPVCAPALSGGEGMGRGSKGGFSGSSALGCVLVVVDNAAGSVDDKNAFFSGMF